MPYIYNADCYCDSCGRAIKRQIRREGFAPADPSDETSYDSSEWPKWMDSDEESDSPQHCASDDDDCPEAVELSDGSKVSALLSTNLTIHGVEYLKELLADRCRTALAEYWREKFAGYDLGQSRCDWCDNVSFNPKGDGWAVDDAELGTLCAECVQEYRESEPAESP